MDGQCDLPAAQFYSVFFAVFHESGRDAHSGASWLPFMLQRTEGYSDDRSLPSTRELYVMA